MKNVSAVAVLLFTAINGSSAIADSSPLAASKKPFISGQESLTDKGDASKPDLSGGAVNNKYKLPSFTSVPRLGPKRAALIASGDSRLSANVETWPTQKALEKDAAGAFGTLGWKLERAHDCGVEGHGFIASQTQGRDVFEKVHPDDPLVVAESVWQYSHHVLMGLKKHRGPILILANWDGKFPGLVGALSLRAGLTKLGVRHSLVWGEDLSDKLFVERLKEWCDTGFIQHEMSHVQPIVSLPPKEKELGETLARQLAHRPAILGCFDEGCMGMFHAIMDDHHLNSCSIFKERLSQAELYHEMKQVTDEEARVIYEWILEKGMTFNLGTDEATELTEAQILEQCQMYIAAARMSQKFGCDAIGIQYQLGLSNTCAASDLAEGLLNCSDRPPALNQEGEPILPGQPITHFNEVDEGAGIDGLFTNRVWNSMGLMPDNTLHDIRWGDIDETGRFVWVFEISGSVPPSHLEGGYAGATGERQPPMYFAKGGSTIKGVCKPGEVVWSRIYIENNSLHMDIGRCESVKLPLEETNRRWEATTPEWPIMHAVTYGVTRDQMMAKHQANHLQVAYGDCAESADRALATKAAMAQALGIKVNLCGTSKCGIPLSQHLSNMA